MDYRAAFPGTSFTSAGPSEQFLAEQGWAKVNVFREHNPKTQKLVPCQPVYEAPWVYTVEVVDKTAEDLATDQAYESLMVRKKRNDLLKDCDWTQLDDYAGSQKPAWAAYRQQLRDIPQQQGFPWEVTWPNTP